MTGQILIHRRIFIVCYKVGRMGWVRAELDVTGHLLVVSFVKIHFKLIQTLQMNKPRAVLLFAYIIIQL